MGCKTKIGWTESTWNPVTGCTKVSAGCAHCYAERVAKRLQAMGQSNYANGFEMRMHIDALEIPLHWKKPRRIFVNSMSDLFHEGIPLVFIREVFSIMAQASWHQFQILTKRAKRLTELASTLYWPPNVWMGVSVENQECADKRIPALLQVPAAVRFVSCEPLLGNIVLTQIGIPDDNFNNENYHYFNVLKSYRRYCDPFQYSVDWVIVGGESGPKARPMELEWARDIRDQCKFYGVPLFMKQLGGYPNKQSSPIDWPEDLRVQEYPREMIYHD